MDDDPIARAADPVFPAGCVVQRIVEPRPRGFICICAPNPPPGAGRLVGGA